MTIVYRCDACGIVSSTITSGGTAQIDTVPVSWAVQDSKHLCRECLAKWFKRQWDFLAPGKKTTAEILAEIVK